MSNAERRWRWALVLCAILSPALLPGCEEDEIEAPIWKNGEHREIALELPPAESAPDKKFAYTLFSIFESGSIWLRNSTYATMDVKLLVTDPYHDWVLEEVGVLLELSPGHAKTMALDATYFEKGGPSSDWVIQIRGDEGAGFYPVRFGRPGQF